VSDLVPTRCGYLFFERHLPYEVIVIEANWRYESVNATPEHPTQKANRAVFVDTYANYYLTKHHGERTGADELVKTELLEALNKLHYTARSGKLLGRRERGDLYEKALLWEQEKTVGPRVRQEIESFDCPILTSLVLRPAVHFNYFPRLRYLFFKNFGDTEERIEKAILSYDLAEKYGWDTVVDTMKYYGVLPPAFSRIPSLTLTRCPKSRVLSDRRMWLRYRVGSSQEREPTSGLELLTCSGYECAVSGC
jgi:hypothetical protein